MDRLVFPLSGNHEQHPEDHAGDDDKLSGAALNSPHRAFPWLAAIGTMGSSWVATRT